MAAIEQGLVPIAVFRDGGLQVVDTSDVVSTDLPSNLRDFDVGTRHKVWGWRTAVRRAQDVEL